MAKDTLIFYLSHYQILKNLSDEDFGKLYKSFFESQLGNEVELPENLIIPFGLVKNQMVLDNEKYEEKCCKNRENGKKGGRPKKTNKANGYFENPNDNDNKKENKKEKNLIEFMEENGFVLYPVDYELIHNWEDNELTRYAIKQSVLNKKFSTKYVDKIISSYSSKGITNVSDAIQSDENFTKTKNGNNPNWLDKEIKEEPLTESEEKELKGILKEFKWHR